MTTESLKIKSLVLGLFIFLIVLEYFTPPAYVFGYLYIGAVLLTSARLSRQLTNRVTLAAVILTMFNLIIPGSEAINTATIANRVIAAIAIMVTGWLSNQNQKYQEAIANQSLQILAQEQLASLREDFVSTLTHDLKTPLLGAVETLKALQEQKFGPVTHSQGRVLEIMSRSHSTTLQLVETLLDVYRNDTEGLKLERRPIDLVKVAQEAILSLTELASTRQVYIQLNYGYYCWVNGDPLQLHRVFVNLIANGINHSLRGGKLEVVFTPKENEHIVKVVDEGQGIPDSQMPMLFERFYQGHSDRQAKGTGLGLYLSRQIIEAHGGRIWAQKRASQGLIFCFCLPIN
ncbi:sensor histidine kinase KdpD [Gloeocapsa sp. PCC 73106]|uniref:sensor histidine kinase n=1 Tax=Gloeocapsa sp. PCC 73106 TaxID=102232 RepID=UPI0002ACD93B|nr:HAMP domain-containing sensor histidine kinase [Gloeocapsa sp. PCC 73106]ELR99884.1 histidine kinase [Gloeocapsa sp. PCC 73106]